MTKATYYKNDLSEQYFKSRKIIINLYHYGIVQNTQFEHCYDENFGINELRFLKDIIFDELKISIKNILILNEAF